MFDIRSNYQNFELLPNGKSSEFVKTLCCAHSWACVQGGVEDDDGEPVTQEKCIDCGAECLRSVGGEILEYDNSKNVQINTSW